MLRQAMGPPNFSLLVLSILLLSLLQTPAYAVKQSYIVYMGKTSHGTNPTQFDIEQVKQSHFNLVESVLDSTEKVQDMMLYSYSRSINGFAAILDETQAAEIQKKPNVISVFLSKKRKLHTTHSWDFLGLESNEAATSNSLWKKAKFGQDVIIGNLDTGVWPESKSFNDKGIGPIPSRWRGICQSEGGILCNRKLIGVRYFNKGFTSQNGPLKPELNNARDTQGHGSHTLSTAGGSFVPGANVFGIGNGTAVGGSPKARVAAYKVCWPSDEGGCYDTDILAAFDAAIADGVDVISLSVGGPPSEFFEDGIALGTYHANKNGIITIASAGNEGPGPGTVSNLAPWIFTVGASTLDREFASYVTLGNKKYVKGSSLSDKSLPSGKFYPLIKAVEARAANATPVDAQLCLAGTLDRKKVAGKIIVCLRGNNARVDKGYQAALAGAVGMILVNDKQNGNVLSSDPHFLPASHIPYTDGEALASYIKSTRKPIATISPVKTEVGLKPNPKMAAFSSRGPNLIEPSILKPDITAPGVNIIAAYTQAVGPLEEAYDKRRTPFITMSGTSMSCPHVAGIAGLLKGLHPDWSPAAIKSAIMTTAKTRANNKKGILDSTRLSANPFAYGAGHVQPNRAADPGLVYDMKPNDYLYFLCAHGYDQSLVNVFSNGTYTCPKRFTLDNFNYPSITVPILNRPTTVTRRVKNVGTPGTYTAHVKAPPRVSVVVKPKTLTFKKVGEEKTFRITFKPLVKGMPKTYAFGRLLWSDGRHNVRSPLVVKHA